MVIIVSNKRKMAGDRVLGKIRMTHAKKCGNSARRLGGFSCARTVPSKTSCPASHGHGRSVVMEITEAQRVGQRRALARRNFNSKFASCFIVRTPSESSVPWPLTGAVRSRLTFHRKELVQACYRTIRWMSSLSWSTITPLQTLYPSLSIDIIVLFFS